MALVPVSPTLSAVTSTGFTISVNVDGNPAPPATYYAFKVVSGATTQYVNASGVLQATLIWLPLLSISVVNAVPNTLHSVSLLAADNASGLNASVEGPSASGTTLAASPISALFSNLFSTTVMANWTANGNPAGTEYEVQISTDANFLVGVTSSGWITTVGHIFSGLSVATVHYARVRARSTTLVATSFVSLGSVSTLSGPDTVKVTKVYNLLVDRGYLITWSPSLETDVTSYKVYRSHSPTDSSAFEEIATVTKPSTSYIDKVTFSFGITWYWKVLALDASGNLSDMALTSPVHEQTYHSFEEQPFPTSVSTQDFVKDEIPMGAINTINTLFTTAFAYRKNSLLVYLNGVRLIRTLDFVEGPGSQQITFTDPPDTGGYLRVDYTKFGA